MTDRSDAPLRELAGATRAYLEAVNSDGEDWSSRVRASRMRLATAACNALSALDAALSASPRSAGAMSDKCTCGGIMFGDGFSHTQTCPSYEAPHRRACVCVVPDPVMQADRKFYCHTCSFETGARPSTLPEVEYHALRSRAEQAERERDEARAWKESAMQVLANWHALGEELQKRYPIRLGEDIPTALLAALRSSSTAGWQE